MSQLDVFENLSKKEWRLKNLYHIIDKTGSKVLLRENAIQKKIRFNPSLRKRVLKARQFGISTGCLVNMLDDTLWIPNVTSCIIAHEQDSIQKLFRIIQRALKYIPKEYSRLVADVDRGGGSKYQIYFPSINSRIYCDLESRGDTINNLHISEAAFVPKPERIKATVEAVPIVGGRITVETTPNGIGNAFYDEWIDPDSNYQNLFFPWFLHEEYKIEGSRIDSYEEDETRLIQMARKLYNIDLNQDQIAFRRYKKNDLKGLFLQEYPEDDQSCFLSTGNAVLDPLKVKAAQSSASKPIRVIDGISIYREYNKQDHYAIGADTAEGFGVDFCAATVLNCVTKEQVATLHGKFKPSDFAHKLKELAALYNKPLLAVERNNHGHAVILELSEHVNYPNLYRHKDGREGFLTDRVTRPIMINALIDAVENKSIAFHDKVFLAECLTLVNDNGKVQAATGKHDDMIMATAIAIQVMIQLGGLDLYKNIKNKILL